MPYKDKEKERERQKTKYQLMKETKPFHQKCWVLRGKAKQFHHEFDLTPEFLESIWTGVCSVSGLPIALWMTNRREEHHAEVDKIIPSQGYTQDNVAWISIGTLKREYGNE